MDFVPAPAVCAVAEGKGGFLLSFCHRVAYVQAVVTPIVAGSLMRAIDYRVLFPYAAAFVALSFVTMCFVRHGDTKAEAKKGLEAFEDMDS